MKEALLGTLLGDGYLEWRGRGVRLHVNHSANFEPYVRWKYEEFAELRPSMPSWNENHGYPSLHFVTRTHPDLIGWRELFYGPEGKIVPANIKQLLTHPKALAVWYMDDGTRNISTGYLLFNTQSFNVSELQLLQEVLRDNFGIETTLQTCGAGRKGKRINVRARSVQAFTDLVQPYVIPSMQYKLGFPVTTDGLRPEIGGSASRQIYSPDQTLAPPPLSGG